jgi:hypothetical protein
MPNRSFKDKIDKVQAVSGLSPTAMEEKCHLGKGTISKNYTSNTEMSASSTKIFLRGMEIREEWWKTGEGDILIKKPTQVQQSELSNDQIQDLKGKFWLEFMERNEEYSAIPKAVLKDYKIVPDKILDVIISSNENEKKALEKSKDLEIESLIRKYELIIDGLNNKIDELKGQGPLKA